MDESAESPLDPFHRHEVVHIAYVIADMFERFVVEHRYTRSHADLAVAAEEASALLHDFYQKVGRLDSPT